MFKPCDLIILDVLFFYSQKNVYMFHATETKHIDSGTLYIYKWIKKHYKERNYNVSLEEVSLLFILYHCYNADTHWFCLC